MGQTLTNGIYLPAEGEVRCYNGLASNWTALDAVVGGYRAHVANENIHITSEERSKWDTGVTQAYVLRYANTSLTALGTVAFSALDNTDNIKIGDKVLDSEGKLFALTAVDTANSTATLSALLIDLSKDSDLSNYYTKTETDNLLSSKADDSGVMHLSGNETAAGLKTFSTIQVTTSINNIMPSVLNMPNMSTGLDISSYLTNLNKGLNTFTPPSNGWIELELGKSSLSKICMRCRQTDGMIYASETSEFSTWGLSFPVIGGKVISIYLYADSLNKAKFYPCQGNV